MRYTRWGVFAALLAGAAVLAALVGTTGGKAAPTAKKKVIIGWAYDSSGQMAPFDNPALAAAKIEAAHINGIKKGTVTFQIKTCDTQNNNPTKAKSCALELLDGGANIIFTTCDVDFATPVVQEAIKRGKLAVSTCIGTDQMGPKRFGTLGKLAFSFGNVAQDEGSAMAQYAWNSGWKTAGLATNTLLVYFKNVVTAFEKRFKQLGGKIVDKESYATGQNNVGTAVGRLNSHKAAVYVTSTAFNELPAFVSGLRALHNTTPILNSWAGDGTYWVTNSPKVTKYYARHVRVRVRRRPEQGHQKAHLVDEGRGGCSRDRRLPRRSADDRRSLHRDQPRARLAQGRRAGEPAGQVPQREGAGRQDQLLAQAAHRPRSPVPRHPDQQQQGQARWARDRQGHPFAAVTQTERRPEDTLRASSVSRSYEGVQAVQEVSLELRRGEVLGLIGPNGAGKSTLVNLLTGFDFPSSGTVQLGERDITRWSSHRRARAGIARSFQHSRSFRTLSVRENVEVSALGVGARTSVARRRAEELLELLGLTELAETRADSLSHGDERRLGVARVLATEPSFVLMDEPAAGLPEAEAPQFGEVVRAVRDDYGGGVLLIDHNMALVMTVCDRIHVLDQGRTLAAGTPDEIRANIDVAAAYLGETAVA